MLRPGLGRRDRCLLRDRFRLEHHAHRRRTEPAWKPIRAALRPGRPDILQGRTLSAPLGCGQAHGPSVVFNPKHPFGRGDRGCSTSFSTARFRELSAYEDIESVPYLDVGLDDPEFRNFAGIYSDAIFEIFHRFAKENLKKERPGHRRRLRAELRLEHQVEGGRLLLRRLRAARRQRLGLRHRHGDRRPAPLYRKSEDRMGCLFRACRSRAEGAFDSDRYDIHDADHEEIADLLANDLILGWVSGRYEIGPRALGNRSILAAPFRDSTRVRLNEIKQREQFRPIAPVCLSEEAVKMVRLRSREPVHALHLPGDDRCACGRHACERHRPIQTVTPATNQMPQRASSPPSRARTGYGVLCNTSLNFNGKGFINNIGDLDAYA